MSELEAADETPVAGSGARGRTAAVHAEGTTHFDAPPETVWRVVIHPETLAQTMPGVERVDVADAESWTAHVKMSFAFVKVRMPLSCRIEDRREPEFALLVARGQTANAGIAMATSFELAEAAGGTDMRWRAEVELSGRASAVGEKMLRPLVDRQVTKVMTQLQARVRGAA